jgi:hypothetical protein
VYADQEVSGEAKVGFRWEFGRGRAFGLSKLCEIRQDVSPFCF